MAYGKDIQARCEMLYIETGSTIEDLKSMFDIPKNTLFRWKKEGDWDNQRKVRVLSPIRLAHKFRDQIGLIIENAETEKRALTASDADMIAKLQKAAFNISPNSTVISIGMDIMKDFMMYLKTKDNDLAQKIVGYSNEFLRTIFKPKAGL